MPPIGWGYAGFVWGYAILWFVLSDAVKMGVYHLEAHGSHRRRGGWARIGANLHHLGGL
jgi:H+-transporting ATPase